MMLLLLLLPMSTREATAVEADDAESSFPCVFHDHGDDDDDDDDALKLVVSSDLLSGAPHTHTHTSRDDRMSLVVIGSCLSQKSPAIISARASY